MQLLFHQPFLSHPFLLDVRLLLIHEKLETYDLFLSFDLLVLEVLFLHETTHKVHLGCFCLFVLTSSIFQHISPDVVVLLSCEFHLTSQWIGLNFLQHGHIDTLIRLIPKVH